MGTETLIKLTLVWDVSDSAIRGNNPHPIASLLMCMKIPRAGPDVLPVTKDSNLPQPTEIRTYGHPHALVAVAVKEVWILTGRILIQRGLPQRD